MRIAGTYFRPGEKARGQRFATTWDRLCPRLAKPQRTSAKHAAGGLSLATYRGDHRTLADTELVYAIGLDLDHDVPPWDDIVHLFSGSAALVHSTWSATPDDLRCRVFLPLSRPVDADRCRRVYRAVVERCEGLGLVIDRAASDPSRFWFLPSCPNDVGALNDERARKKLPPVTELPPFRAHVCTGRPVNVDWALHTVPAEAPPPAPPPPAERPRVGDHDRIVERAARWLAHRDPAIEGSGGDKHTFETACSIVRGFDLDDASAYRLLADWNATCRPPWSEAGLRRKIREARERGRMPIGALRDARRAS